MKNNIIILGAGITGLSCGYFTGVPIYEMLSYPGGICTSYYMSLDGKKNFERINEETYRFEVGGGHWIFGAENEILNFINSLVSTKSYKRNSAVYLPDLNLYIPYPLQNNLSYLPEEIKMKALKEILKSEEKEANTFMEWLEINFGNTLCELFFFPFHELYTAGLYTKISPQDKFKTPIDKELILKSVEKKISLPEGYNTTFIYPIRGLDSLINSLAQKCKIEYNKEVIKIDLKKKEIVFKNGGGVKYKKIISTLPLNKLAEIVGIDVGEETPPYTSVIVVNIGATKGIKCPDYHWIYIPRSKAGFYRVGFYSNVDTSFLPAFSREKFNRVSIYVEKAYIGGKKPSDIEIKELCNNFVEELREWKFIETAEVVDYTWIGVAYTWEYPNSNWKEKIQKILRENNIYSIGRYGKWKFQGIADSIKDGLTFSKHM